MRTSAGSSASISTPSSEPRPLRLQFEYSTHASFCPALERHSLLLRCLPAHESFQQVCSERLSINEAFTFREARDGFGNRIVTAVADVLHQSFDCSCSGTMEMTTYCIPDAEPHPMFSLASRLTTPTHEMRWLLPTLTGDTLADCMQIAHAVHRHIVYTPGVTGMLTTADDVFRHRKGVCQDYAHLMIALCRSKGIFARYVNGFIIGEGQTHAWVEVSDGRVWYAYDPTHDHEIFWDYIKIAHGRDADDCPTNRGRMFSWTSEVMTINTKLDKINPKNITE